MTDWTEAPYGEDKRSDQGLETRSGSSHDKLLQRAELIQVLAEGILQGKITRFYREQDGNLIDLADPNELDCAFDALAYNDDAPVWRHFKDIIALRTVIKLYRRLT